MITLQQIARALDGEVMAGGYVMASPPGHSAKDRSMSVRLDPRAPGGLLVNLFGGGDPLAAKDDVLARCGLPPFKPNGERKTARATQSYGFCDPATGEVKYHKARQDSGSGAKGFYITPKERGGSPPLLYGGERLADLGEGQPVWIVEGEKKVDRMRELGAIAVSGDTGASSKLSPGHVELLRGLPVIMWPDSDEPGERYIAKAAAAILIANPAADIRIVRPFTADGEKGRDVCDWHGDAAALAKLAADAVPYAPPGVKQTGHAPPEKAETVLAKASEIVPEAFSWIWKYYLARGKLHIIAGAPGGGKTTIYLSFAAIISSGGTWPDGKRAACLFEHRVHAQARRCKTVPQSECSNAARPGAGARVPSIASAVSLSHMFRAVSSDGAQKICALVRCLFIVDSLCFPLTC